jgi:hypothetical protein
MQTLGQHLGRRTVVEGWLHAQSTMADADEKQPAARSWRTVSRSQPKRVEDHLDS